MYANYINVEHFSVRKSLLEFIQMYKVMFELTVLHFFYVFLK